MQIWGILNVTPDSFSDGGKFVDVSKAVHHAIAMHDCGAHVIDIGGVSTRPKGLTYGQGAEDVSIDEECARVLPVVERLMDLKNEIVLSIDTIHAEVACEALLRGAKIVNDVSGGRNLLLLKEVSKAQAEVVLMHNRGNGSIAPPNTIYSNLLHDVMNELEHAISQARNQGIDPQRIWVDPGIGFAKTPQQSVFLISQIKELSALGSKVLLGASRKSFIGALFPWPNSETPNPHQRIGGTTATTLWALLHHVNAVRVHDVAQTFQAIEMFCFLRDHSSKLTQ